ncbi:SF1B family DNA helicase RecD2 [Candidatus Desulforudis audaxviator]|uniref:ATP-dependent RecD2 DNA helicase n=1 Tax=Desulforudis audaxviator (strain MP104C) TaxID=477974 RepID=B1I4I2_DESAP|nr:ATP-dependent RecD-like DNA helicase [Candidatus Desulforudis audaxviator]ACA59902.1 helicase, RecD/TraA family [Candidatus Desulforudis audaxviator MP104C]AZK59911.1 helicase, RecD/TraA family [Candidatus Desulforudis audaxviator]
MEVIHGYLERITYYNEENHFTVARLQETGKRELTTIVGNLAGITPGESLKLTGKWVQDPRFGPQFRVERFETVVPATVNGIRKYLGSGLIRGIGPVMAKRIVKVFGLQTLDVIDRSPGRLTEVDGIGPKRVELITRAWADQKEIRGIMIFLQDHGISAAYAAKIYRQYGNASVEIVRTNPYRLAADVHGIGFVTADRIARQVGIDPNSVTRAEEGTLYVLNESTSEGHVYLPYETLVSRAAEMLEVSRDLVVEAVERLAADRRVVREDEAVYLTPFYVAETKLAERLNALRDAGAAVRRVDTAQVIPWVEKRLGLRLAEKQAEAVSLAVSNKILVITGGPGTGKTTIIRAIISIFQALGARVLLAAPTGRAAKRMQEASGHEARTIHRLLEFSPGKGGFQRNQDFPLDADAVIVDEASMIDTLLMNSLVRAVPLSAALILVGDTNQLPPVGPGNVLRDIIDSGRFGVVTLTEIFRQSRESRIVVNAHRINRGEFPDLSPLGSGRPSDFYFIQEEDPETAVQTILKLCKVRIPRRFGYHPIRDIQVLTPMYRGLVGAANLNAELQNLLNPGKDGVVRGHRMFRTGDKVMQVVNNYQKEVFNGDIGRITAVHLEQQQLKVDFDGRAVSYEFSELDELVLAYAVSVHKAQGSEYPVVIMPVMTQHYVLLQRNLVYTGVTRGRNLVVLVGTKKALAIAIRNDEPRRRYTRLRERLAYYDLGNG